MNNTKPAVVISIQRMVCTSCGAEANATCNCGKPYVPKAVRAREAVEANPEKSDRAIAADLGVSKFTVNEARKELAGTGQLEDGPRIGLDGKTRKLPEKKPEIEADDDEPEEDDENAPTPEDYVKLLSDYWKLKDSNTALTAALNAKEKETSRNWPEGMTAKQIKQRDKCLRNIAWWQRDLEQLFGEVTGCPSWRVEVTTKDGRRLGTGARFGTRGEAEFYNTHFAPSQLEGDYASGEIIPCETEKATVLIDGDSIRFRHGDCVLLNWRSLAAAP